MSDSDIGVDELLPAHGLAAISAFKHGPGYVLALLGDDGELHTYTLSGPRLRQVVTIMCNAVRGIPSGSVSTLQHIE
ncbi:hypothetical protein MARA_12160 [Mycolicibacterium arabiense]|uniref:Uncharacterized protein n=1 Tax=Mycolicibacterium arabiense TaxID=1286181 RepID=A0A7I7RT12_9MYCO|nr:hypothetical protein [Mycolicibacterium arabiense]MCV7373125.1 hypothetical protein [Mycolicibacterium arabiense]BBY47748.1 hypothetical protein MARA_12160 [Mycolicibacterium arabiense]